LLIKRGGADRKDKKTEVKKEGIIKDEQTQENVSEVVEELKEEIENNEEFLLEEEDDFFTLENIDSDLLLSGDYIRAFLTEKEWEFYKSRKQKYIEDFELNPSSDELLLEETLLLEIFRLRYLNQKMRDPRAKVDKKLSECVDQIRQNLDAMGMLRKQRLKEKDKAEESVADLIAQFDKEQLLKRQKEYKKEEEKNLAEKKRREEEITTYEDAVKKFDELVEGSNNGNTKKSSRPKTQ